MHLAVKHLEDRPMPSSPYLPVRVLRFSMPGFPAGGSHTSEKPPQWCGICTCGAASPQEKSRVPLGMEGMLAMAAKVSGAGRGWNGLLGRACIWHSEARREDKSSIFHRVFPEGRIAGQEARMGWAFLLMVVLRSCCSEPTTQAQNATQKRWEAQDTMMVNRKMNGYGRRWVRQVQP